MKQPPKYLDYIITFILGFTICWMLTYQSTTEMKYLIDKLNSKLIQVEIQLNKLKRLPSMNSEHEKKVLI